MNRILLRRIHRWVFILVGIFMLSQLASGLLMALPADLFGVKVRWPGNTQVDYRQAVLSPAEAIARLDLDSTPAAAIKRVQLRQIDDQLFYSIVLADNSEQLIAATTGRQFSFTPELAESMIRSRFGIEAPLAEIEHLTEHSSLYPWGSLPAYRLAFEDSSWKNYFLVQNDLKMFVSTPVTRVRAAITSLHEFEPIKLVTHDERVRKGLLIVVFGTALAGAVTGMLMLLPRRRKTAGS